MDDQWISKRELLCECGISYGQLYRWKREGLIPENWFVKRATTTGQETFLPRKQSIERVKLILGEKGRCSQASLQKKLYPTKQMYKSTTLIRLPGVTKPLIQIAALSGAKEFNYTQALCAMIGAQIVSACADAACPLPDEQLRSVLKNLLSWAEEQSSFSGAAGTFVLIQHTHGVLPLLVDRFCSVTAPIGCKTVYTLPLDEIPERFNKPLEDLSRG